MYECNNLFRTLLQHTMTAKHVTKNGVKLLLSHVTNQENYWGKKKERKNRSSLASSSSNYKILIIRICNINSVLKHTIVVLGGSIIRAGIGNRISTGHTKNAGSTNHRQLTILARYGVSPHNAKSATIVFTPT